MDYSQVGEAITAAFGGKNNIEHVMHCELVCVYVCVMKVCDDRAVCR